MSAIRPLSVRFWAKVDRSGGADACWLWTAYIKANGYGTIGLGAKEAGKGYAHRVSWALDNGPIPPGMEVCHRCDNRRCVNPAHLFLGTHAENCADARHKGRMNVGEHNHFAKLTVDKVREIRALGADKVPHREISLRYGIHHVHVSEIINRRVWRAA